MPALTRSSVGSGAISEADSTTVCPRSAKKRRKRLLISAESMAVTSFNSWSGWCWYGSSRAYRGVGRRSSDYPAQPRQPVAQLALGAVVGGLVVVAAHHDI